jgi:hypothetical protein
MCAAAESCTLGLRQQPDLSWDNPDVGVAMHIDEYTGRMIVGEVTKGRHSTATADATRMRDVALRRRGAAWESMPNAARKG